MLPKTREEARQLNIKHYFTGDPCPRGHLSPRFTSVGTCKECGKEKAMQKHVHTTTKRRAYSNLEGFIAASKKIYDNLYDYSKAIYINAHTPLELSCVLHGAFLISPTNHMQKKGCPVCSQQKQTQDMTKPLAQFIKEARVIWGDSYDYSSVKYLQAKAPIKFTCKIHNEVVTQTPTNHLSGKQACPKCNHMKSAQEDKVASHASIFTPVIRRDRLILSPKELDIVMPEVKLAIEYCGMYWHSFGDKESENQNKCKHYLKYLDCQKQGIRLLTVYESEWQERPAAIKRLIRNAIGKSKGRLMARKCELKRVSNAEARAFYGKYHPQGGTGSGEHYGLYWKDKLVACMRFSLGANDRGSSAKSRVWTLGRYATRVNVAGAASRLFKAFLAEFDPSEVKSFSDNRYFSGGMYVQLGFTLELEVPPDYQVWSPKLGLLPKPHYQRRVLAKRQRDHGVEVDFTEEDKRTEREVTYAMGARRIYDCGKKRWVWKKSIASGG
jgi:hypothetical protein